MRKSGMAKYTLIGALILSITSICFCKNEEYQLTFKKSNTPDYPSVTVKRTLLEMTVSLWIRTRGDSSTTLFSFSQNSTFLRLTYFSNRFGLVDRERNIYAGNFTNDGRWHHVMMVWSTSLVKWIVYLDGMTLKEGNLENFARSIPGGSTFTVGNHPTIVSEKSRDTKPYKGNMTLINIWSHRLEDTNLYAEDKRCQEREGDVISWSQILRTSQGEKLKSPSSLCRDRKEQQVTKSPTVVKLTPATRPKTSIIIKTSPSTATTSAKTVTTEESTTGVKTTTMVQTTTTSTSSATSESNLGHGNEKAMTAIAVACAVLSLIIIAIIIFVIQKRHRCIRIRRSQSKQPISRLQGDGQSEIATYNAIQALPSQPGEGSHSGAVLPDDDTDHSNDTSTYINQPRRPLLITSIQNRSEPSGMEIRTSKDEAIYENQEIATSDVNSPMSPIYSNVDRASNDSSPDFNPYAHLERKQAKSEHLYSTFGQN